MSRFAEKLAAARASGDVSQLLELIPYAKFLGFTLVKRGDALLGLMPFSEHLIGNSAVRAIHGGTLGALMELTASSALLALTETVHVPKTVNITVEYLRGGHTQDTWARAEIIRHGRRVANVRVVCWQDDEHKPIAAANLHFLLTPPGGGRQATGASS
jgi:uncharacterized protein (TIGR00369 family)